MAGKNLLLGAFAFFLFSISISILQTSCDKDANASIEISNDINDINKILLFKLVGNHVELWKANYDGSGQSRINISIPGGYSLSSRSAFISPDRKKIFFLASKYLSGGDYDTYILSCNIDGSNVTQVMLLGNQDWNSFVGVY